jgi:Tfp pilus assembly protein PilN
VSGQINLYNPALRLRRQLITGPTILLALIVIVLGVLGAQAYQQIRIAALTSEAAAVEATLKDHQDELARLTREVSRMKPRKKTAAELAAAEALLRGHQQVAAAVDAGLIGTTEGFSEFMRALARRALSGVWLTSLSIDLSGEGISIAGRTLDPGLLPDYIKRLNDEPVIRGRGFAYLELQLPSPDKRYHDFGLRVDGHGDADVQAAATAAVAGTSDAQPVTSPR